MKLLGSKGWHLVLAWGFLGKRSGPIGSQLAWLSLRVGMRLGREPVLSPGLGQDGFLVVDNGSGKVAVPSGADLIDRGRWIAGDRGAKTHIPFGVGGPVQWSAGTGGLQCLASVAGCQRAVGLLVWFGILTKWLSFTRLETRTKESYIYASDRVGNSFAE